MHAIKQNGVRKYSMECILATIAIKFYKSPKTIENIVFNRTSIADSYQASLFA